MSVLHCMDGSVNKMGKQPYPPGEIGPTNVCQSSLCVQWGRGSGLQWEKCAMGPYREEGPGLQF